jgi:hypothetical protein
MIHEGIVIVIAIINSLVATVTAYMYNENFF